MSNQLQALLKANKVEIVVDLDKDKSLSNIKNGLKNLTKELDGFNIELGVKFNPNVKELNREIKALQNKINDSKSVDGAIELQVKIDTSVNQLNQDINKLQMKIQNAKTIKPIKLDVRIDVQGSAVKITQELGQIKDVLDRFKGDYSKALNNIKALGNEEFTDLLSDRTVRKLQGNVDNVKEYMSRAFGDGIISTKTIRDSEDNIQALTATIKKETGEIHSALFKLNENGSFEFIKREDVNNMEAQTKRAKDTIAGLADEVARVKNAMSESKSFELFGKLKTQEYVSEGEITKLKNLVKAEKDLISTQEKREQFQRALNKAMKEMAPDVSKVTSEIAKMDKNLDSLDINQLDEMAKKLKVLQAQYVEDERMLKRREALMKKVAQEQARLEETRIKSSNTPENKAVFDQAEKAFKNIEVYGKYAKNIGQLEDAYKGLGKAMTSVDDLISEGKMQKYGQSIETQVNRAQDAIRKLKDIGKITEDEMNSRFKEAITKGHSSFNDIEEYGKRMRNELNKAKQEQKDLINNFVLIEKHTNDYRQMNIQSGVFNALNTRDTNALKRYFGELKDGEVSTIKITEKTNQFGEAVNQVKVKMDGAGKTVEAYTFEINKASSASDQQIRQTGQSIEDNTTKSMGFFAQMETAMLRVPTWILSMQTFQQAVNGMKAVTREIIEIDSAMMEISRVASDGLNLDVLFSGAVTQAKELGTTVHEVLGSLGEFARSYDNFTESQLLAVNKTASIMANVSDLNLEQSSESLIGTMNAFNISAEDSVRIVDSLNEVNVNQPPFTAM